VLTCALPESSNSFQSSHIANTLDQQQEIKTVAHHLLDQRLVHCSVTRRREWFTAHFTRSCLPKVSALRRESHARNQNIANTTSQPTPRPSFLLTVAISVNSSLYVLIATCICISLLVRRNGFKPQLSRVRQWLHQREPVSSQLLFHSIRAALIRFFTALGQTTCTNKHRLLAMSRRTFATRQWHHKHHRVHSRA
jgi:hypothetical protein